MNNRQNRNDNTDQDCGSFLQELDAELEEYNLLLDEFKSDGQGGGPQSNVQHSSEFWADVVFGRKDYERLKIEFNRTYHGQYRWPELEAAEIDEVINVFNLAIAFMPHKLQKPSEKKPELAFNEAINGAQKDLIEAYRAQNDDLIKRLEWRLKHVKDASTRQHTLKNAVTENFERNYESVILLVADIWEQYISIEIKACKNRDISEKANRNKLTPFTWTIWWLILFSRENAPVPFCPGDQKYGLKIPINPESLEKTVAKILRTRSKNNLSD